MKNCPKCQVSVSDTAKFCVKCGFNIKKFEEENAARECFCPECGTKFSGGWVWPASTNGEDSAAFGLVAKGGGHGGYGDTGKPGDGGCGGGAGNSVVKDASVAGGLGIFVTVVLDLVASVILEAITGIGGLAALPWQGAIILILISMVLTFIAGLIPAGLAAKKDPVVALRSE